MGASWEGFALEMVLRVLPPTQAYYWATYSGAELDLLLFINGHRYGLEFKFNEAPDKTKSMTIAMESLDLDQLFIVSPVQETWPLTENITVCPISQVRQVLIH